MKKKVLIVEDDPALAKVIAMSLEELNCSLLIAKTGTEAITLLDESVPDVVILDLLLPTVDGFEVLRYMRASEKLKKVPVIVLTNYSRETARKETLELGANEFVLKTSIHVNEIPGLVSKYL
jgi:CheY-like chemotaxis protein